MEKEKFQEILHQVAEIYGRNKDYGEDDLSNFRVCERMGVPAWKGVLVTMAEEMGRLMTVSKLENLNVESETVVETLTELATHCIIARMLLEESPGAKSPDSSPRRGRRPGQKERKDSPVETADSQSESLSMPTKEE